MLHHKRALWIFLSVIFIFFGSSAIADEKVISYPTNAAVQVGVGWNLEKNAAAPNTCIKIDDDKSYYEVEKQIKESKLTTGNSEFTLSSSLGISYNESLKESASLAGSGESAHDSLEASLKASFDMTKDNSYVLAKQHVITKWRVLNTSGLVELSSEAQALTADEFTEQCGDGYVSRIEYGGAYYALLNMHTSSYQEALSAKAQFSESARVVVPTASASEKSSSTAESNLSSSQDSGSLSITTTEIGGSPPDHTGTNIGTVLDNYSTFPQRVNSDPSEFLMAIEPYPVQSGMGFNDIDAPTKVIYRELVKWEYLSSTIGKLIEEQNNQSTTPGSSFSVGVSFNNQELIDLQKLADGKVDVITTVAGTCVEELKNSSRTSSSIQSACSLVGKTVSFAESLTNKLDQNNIANGEVAVLESDLPYLVHLPYSTMFSLDGTTVSGVPAAEVIFNQVNNIYKHRCLDNLHITNFCESQALVQEAVNKFIEPSAALAAADDSISDEFTPLQGTKFTIVLTSAGVDYYFSPDHSYKTYFLTELQTSMYSYWTINANGNLSSPKLPGYCLELSSPGSRPQMVICSPQSQTQRWLFHDKKIMLRSGGNSVITMPLPKGAPTTNTVDSALEQDVTIVPAASEYDTFFSDNPKYFMIKPSSEDSKCLQVDGGHTAVSSSSVSFYDCSAAANDFYWAYDPVQKWLKNYANPKVCLTIESHGSAALMVYPCKEANGVGDQSWYPHNGKLYANNGLDVRLINIGATATASNTLTGNDTYTYKPK